MKKWSGGILIVILSFILVVRYTNTYFSTPPPKQVKQSTYDFFHNQPTKDPQAPEMAEISPIAKSSRVNETIEVKVKEKPSVIDIPELSDLYDFVNKSKEGMRNFATWPHLKSVLLRSDGLPETSEGIKEAFIAWRELITILEEKTLGGESDGGNVNRTSEMKCPLSVSTFGEVVNSSRRALLELPCGLVEDSSITLIGIPNGKNRRFQIELEGARFQNEQKPAIVLHYDVYIPEENSTKNPVIVQNTWVSEVGWGKEERCPGGKSMRYTQVDGLDSCYEQLIRSTMEESHNVSHNRFNNSVVHAHVRANFPFSEGSPFTATLWAGLEGFHMTVNGRHETSFKYKENLEPWLVNRVQVIGGVNILSGIAKDLPVSEDLELIVDADKLKAPPLLRKRIFLLVGVFSTGNNFERRMALRRSWMQYEAVRAGTVAVRFLIGFHKNAKVNLDLWKEAQAYGDIQFMPFVDYYSLISLKTIAVCILGTKILPAKHIMKTDDDAFVRIDEVISNLKGKDNSGLLYGLIAFQSSPHRDTDSKWFVSEEEWPKDSYPPWAHGPGYVVSRDIAKFIVRGHQERELKLFKLEDVAMGIWVDEYKNNGKEVKYVSDERFHNTGCEMDYILAHYQNPRKVLCLWEKLRKEQIPACCE